MRDIDNTITRYFAKMTAPPGGPRPKMSVLASFVSRCMKKACNQKCFGKIKGLAILRQNTTHSKRVVFYAMILHKETNNKTLLNGTLTIVRWFDKSTRQFDSSISRCFASAIIRYFDSILPSDDNTIIRYDDISIR